MIHAVFEDQLPGAIRFHRFHEGIGHQHRHVEHAQARRVGFCGDEGFDIGVVTPHGGHHRAAPAACAHDGAAHRIPNIHERQRARGIRRHTFHIRAARTDGGEIIADAAALLHGQRRLFEHVKDAGHAVRHRAHHKAVEQGHLTRGAGTCGDAAGGKIFEIFQRGIEFVFPLGRVFFDARQIAGNTPPAVLHRYVNRRAVCFLKAILHIPDLLGNRRGETAHPWLP